MAQLEDRLGNEPARAVRLAQDRDPGLLRPPFSLLAVLRDPLVDLARLAYVQQPVATVDRVDTREVGLLGVLKRDEIVELDCERIKFHVSY